MCVWHSGNFTIYCIKEYSMHKTSSGLFVPCFVCVNKANRTSVSALFVLAPILFCCEGRFPTRGTGSETHERPREALMYASDSADRLAFARIKKTPIIEQIWSRHEISRPSKDNRFSHWNGTPSSIGTLPIIIYRQAYISKVAVDVHTSSAILHQTFNPSSNYGKSSEVYFRRKSQNSTRYEVEDGQKTSFGKCFGFKASPTHRTRMTKFRLLPDCPETKPCFLSE
ncbi:uncharacterized protein LOC131880889 isoform X2 [Tigriopus californicus]|uniref:uncharacterized protein LOC131880889 isoform X2 n=1 Tax=Tigriopus californicus TaxID=6832 RepID=UPI0027DA0659|nr:uncharacterized protein LOC131880889 isoform X2 [Tigriopus californicus]